MALPTSILRGYDRFTEKIVARALGITLPKHRKRHKGGEHHMKIPMSALRTGSVKASAEKSGGKKKKPGFKFGALKGKKKPSDNDGDEY